MTMSLDLSLIRRFLPRRRYRQPFELLDALVLEPAFKDEMRAFVIDLAEQLKGRKQLSSNPMILARAPRGSGKTCLARALTSALFRLGALRREKPHEIWLATCELATSGKASEKAWIIATPRWTAF